MAPLTLVTLAGWRASSGAWWARAFDGVTLAAACAFAYLMIHFGFVTHAFH